MLFAAVRNFQESFSPKPRKGEGQGYAEKSMP